MKQFLIIGNTQAITYKEIFPHIKLNQLWLGVSSFNSGMYFQVPENYQYADTYKFDRERNGRKVMRVSSICWYTNIPHEKRNTPLDLYKKYNPTDYPKYDNYDAIEVSKVVEIPEDYNGVMGVPITFLDKYCPTQFEILGVLNPKLKGKLKYKRMLIKRKTKKFLIIGNGNAVTYKEIFPYIKNNQLWLGVNSVKKFIQTNNEIKNFGNIRWVTNIPHKKKNQPLKLTQAYSPDEYPKYDNYDAIYISRVVNIPKDYYRVMGVPISFLDKYCSTQFEIVDARDAALYDKQKNKQTYLIKDADGSINGKNTYARICIKRVKNNETK